MSWRHGPSLASAHVLIHCQCIALPAQGKMLTPCGSDICDTVLLMDVALRHLIQALSGSEAALMCSAEVLTIV
jgi:hypothetical protein